VSELIWDHRPTVVQPVVITAFEGWNDAGDAASNALDLLIDKWDAVRFASIDAENFYDFTASRPEVRIVDGEVRTIDWPENGFWHAAPPGAPDVILLRGVEPHLRWRTFCDQILDIADQLNARLVLSLGALLADVPHSRPCAVYGTAYDPAVIEALGLEPSRYEGPTGIVGVLHQRCAEVGVNSASFWAAVPSYVAAAPSPKAQRALIERVCEMLRTTVDASDLVEEEVDYEAQISALVAEDPETSSYVQHLEEEHDRMGRPADVDALVAEVERFLRGQ
jgi:proteasome assembly chaperone (PAC2) family protein